MPQASASGGSEGGGGDLLEGKEIENWDCVEVSLFLAKIGLPHLQEVISLLVSHERHRSLSHAHSHSLFTKCGFFFLTFRRNQVFLEQEVDGSILLDVSDDDLELIPMDSPTERRHLLESVQIQRERSI